MRLGWGDPAGRRLKEQAGVQDGLTATLTADNKLDGNTQWTGWDVGLPTFDAKAFGGMQWMPRVQLAVMRSNQSGSLAPRRLVAKTPLPGRSNKIEVAAS